MDNIFSSNDVLVVVDFSAWTYMTIFNAVNSWQSRYRLEASAMLKDPEETDQENLPNLLVSEHFKKELKNSVMKKLHSLDWILKNNCQDVLDSADNIVTVFAEDDFVSRNFRRKLYPEYKGTRNVGKKAWNYSAVRDYVQNSIFPELDLDAKNGYSRIRVEGAEADDVIAVLMKDSRKKWLAKILISSDHDFCQIEGIRQYSIFGEEVIPWADKNKGIKMSPSELKFVKICSGDGSDNIPQILPRMGVKTALKYYRDKAKLKEILRENESAAKQFLLNRQLVDFDLIPEELQKKILEEADKKLGTVVSEQKKLDEELCDLMDL